MRILACIFLLLLVTCCLTAQVTISGKVQYAQQPVQNATVVLTGTQRYQVLTDSLGQFAFPALSAARYRLGVTHLSFAAYVIGVTLTKDTSLAIALQLGSDSLAGVTVTAGKPFTPTANIELSQEEIVRKGSVLGEANIYEALQKQAGIIHTTEVNSGLFVRGLNAGNTAMLLDGVNAFNGNHLLGIYPPVNADAFSNLQLLKDNIHPKYNGYLGSYLLLETPDQVPDSLRGTAELGILTSKLGVRVPVVKDKVGIISNIRRSYFDGISRTYNKWNNNKPDFSPLPLYGFYDWNNTVVVDSKAGLFKLNTMSSADQLSMEDGQLDLDATWKNWTMVINWQFQLSGSLGLTVNTGTSRYQADASYNSIGRRLNNAIRESTVMVDMQWTPSKKYSLDYGLFAKGYQLNMVSATLDGADSTPQRVAIDQSASYVGGYVYGKLELTPRLQLRLGTNVNRYKADKPFSAIAPTFSMTYSKHRQGINVQVSRQLQYAHLYVPTGLQLPINVWYPSVQNAPPEDAWHFTATYSRVLSSRIKASFAGYYILLANKTEFLDKNYFSSLDFNTVQGAGASRGMELNVYYSSHSWQLEGHYTYGKTTARFPGINKGVAYSLPYDIRHKADLSLLWHVKKSWTFALSQYVQSGGVITLPTGLYLHQDADVEGAALQPVPVYTVRNNYRMPLSHRMDVSVKHTFAVNRLKCSWTAGIYNTYSYQNPYFIYFKIRKREDGERYLQAKTKSILPLVPFFSIHTEF